MRTRRSRRKTAAVAAFLLLMMQARGTGAGHSVLCHELQKEFRDNVMDYFTNEYLCGRTPNPCIACNRYVKWEALLQRSLSIGADYMRPDIMQESNSLPMDGRMRFANSVTAAKDQTYALYNLTQEQLSHTLMPVGDYTKIRFVRLQQNRSSGSKRRIPRKSASCRIRITLPLSRTRQESWHRRQFREYKG